MFKALDCRKVSEHIIMAAAQNSSAKSPDHSLLVQYPSAHFPGCACCVRGPGVFQLVNARTCLVLLADREQPQQSLQHSPMHTTAAYMVQQGAHTRAHTHTSTHTHTHTHTHTRTHAHTRTQTHTHTYIHTHIHTCAHKFT